MLFVLINSILTSVPMKKCGTGARDTHFPISYRKLSPRHAESAARMTYTLTIYIIKCTPLEKRWKLFTACPVKGCYRRARGSIASLLGFIIGLWLLCQAKELTTDITISLPTNKTGYIVTNILRKEYIATMRL